MLDFRIKRDDKGDVIVTEGIYEIEMDTTYNDEIPVFTNDIQELYAQSALIMTTINLKQIKYHQDYGINAYDKLNLNQQGLSDLATISVLQSISNMILEMFENNEEVAEWAGSGLSYIEIGGGE